MLDVYTKIVYNHHRKGVIRMNPRGELLKTLKKLGFELQENGTRHDKYYSKELRYTVTVSRSSKFDEDDARMILQEIRRETRKQGK